MLPKLFYNDKFLKPLAEKYGELIHLDLPSENDVYFDLISSIISQQLSNKAAFTIKNRFLDLFPNRYPDSQLVLEKTVTELRTAGISNSKAQYIKNIAEYSLVNGLDYSTFEKMTDNEVIDYLIIIKGVGKWTAEMILIFSLKRPDVFPTDDLVIKNGTMQLAGLTDHKNIKQELIKVSEQWAPYRTWASLLIWKWKDLEK